MLVGRTAEIAAIDRLLADASQGRSGVLVVRGEAGAGKSALLQHAVESAEGFTVLRGLGVELECELAYAALHQILRPAFTRIDGLPGPQAAALRAAFALSDETVDERFRVAAGVLGLLAALGEERPLLCVIDDAQWLDQPSTDALFFAARRLEAESIALLFAAREDGRTAFEAPGLPELRLHALSTADSRALVADRLGDAVASPVLDWLVESASGNALALVELPAMLTPRQLAGEDPLGGKLPPTTSVEQVYLERVAALPAAVQALLVLAAAEETGARAAVERAATMLDLELDELSAAEAAGLVRIDSEQIVFRHPLVRSAVYRGASFTDREGAHRALAAAATAAGDPDRAAWHRAAAATGADEQIAAELESTAERARLRSGHAAAASALERAAELTADGEAKGRRLVAATAAAWHAGQPDRTLALYDRARPFVSDPTLQAELDHVRGDVEQRCGALLDAGRILIEAAAAAAPVNPRRALEMLFDAASCGMQSGDYALVVQAGQQARALPASDDEEERFLADLLIGVGSLWLDASSRDVPLVADVIARAHAFDKPRLLAGAAMGAGTIGDEAGEAALLRRAVSLARASGAVDALTLALLSVAVAGVLAGRLTMAPEATEGLRLATETRLTGVAIFHRALLGWLAAVSGHDDQCLAAAAEVAGSAATTRNALANSIAEWSVSLLDLSRGRPDQALNRLVALRTAPVGFGHPLIVLMGAADLVEAAVRTGHEEEARTAHAMLEGFAGPGAPPWSLALAARCRALLADDEADAHFEEALRLHAQVNRPFDRARTELLYGEFLRRRRRRADSREHLRAAVELLEDLGAEPWADRARTELRASGETARRRDPSSLGQLTPQELQIARLVAEGASNKEVAAQLFLSPRTVEYHLRKVFMKLGIASRSELFRQGLGGEPTAEPPPVAVS